MKNILFTGGSGLLAVNWSLHINENFNVISIFNKNKIFLPGIRTYFHRIDSLSSCEDMLNLYNPHIVINTAAITDVEFCENNPVLAYKTNTLIAKNLAICCNRLGVKLIQISTDHLFSGHSKMYTEDISTNPLNIYGKTKAQAERLVLENCSNSLAVRTNFFGQGFIGRHSFSDFIVKSLINGNKINLFNDVFFTPIIMNDLFEIVNELINIDANGIYNISSNERVSKFDFGLMISKSFNLNSDLINSISIDNMKDLVKRPKDMSLSNLKVKSIINHDIDSLYTQINKMKKNYKNKNLELL